MKILIFLLLAFGAFIFYVRLLERQSVFVPSRQLLTNPAAVNLAFEDVMITTQDRIKIHGWWIPGSDARQRATLLFLHGNAGNIGDRMDKLVMFHRMGLNVLIIDYRGYGLSDGNPTEAGMYKDGLAAYDFLLARPETDPEKIVAYGESLGGAAAVDLAAKKKLKALILDSTFTNAVDMAKRIYPFIPAIFVAVKLDSLAKIKDIRVPKLFIHSEEDELVPFEFGEKLYAAAPEPKMFVRIKGGHNDGHVADERVYREGIGKFLGGLNLLPGY